MNSSSLKQNFKENACRICLRECIGNKSLSDTVECGAKKTIALLDLVLKVANVVICLQKEILPSGICRNCIQKLISAYELIQLIKASEQTHVQNLQWTLTQKFTKTAEVQSNLKSGKFEDAEYLEEECQMDTESSSSDNEENDYNIDEKSTLFDEENTEAKAWTSLEKFEFEISDESVLHEDEIIVPQTEKSLETPEVVWCDNLNLENKPWHITTPYNESAAYEVYRKALEKTPRRKIGPRPRNRGITDMSKALKCDKCARFFSKNETYKAHIETAHREILSEEQIAEITEKLNQKMEQEGKTVMHCPYCLQCYVRKDYMKRHIATYHADKVTLDNIEEHNLASDCEMESKNLKRNVTCDICGKIVARTGLKTHKLRHTSVELPYHCKVCNQSFSRQSTLNDHQLRHSGKFPHKCEICNKGFIQSSQLKRHMGIHTNFRPFTCSFCGKKFRAGNYLKTHLRQHTGERPFKCSVCNKNYTNYNSLKSHKRLRNHYDEEFLKAKFVEQLSKDEQERKSIEYLEDELSDKDHFVEEYLSDIDVGNCFDQEMCL